MIRMNFHILLVGLLLIGMLMGGCTQPLNARSTLGGSYLSPTFRTSSTAHNPLESPAIFLLGTTPKPRSAWTPTQYLAPFDGVVHTPTMMALKAPKRTDLPRPYGRYPSADDVLSMQSSLWFDDVLFTFSELGRSVFGTPYAAGYFTYAGYLSKQITSPRTPWKRTRADGWSSGFPSQTTPPSTPDQLTPDQLTKD